jgi:transposase InsO family protein
MSGYPGKLNEHAKHTLIHRIFVEGWSIAEAARMANVSRQAAHRWVRRYREHGVGGLQARTRKPLRSPRALSAETVQRILVMRRASGRGPQWIGWKLSLATSTVHRVLRRAQLHRLMLLDRVTRAVVRYEHPVAGDLLHLDVKRLARVPAGGGRHFDPLWRHDRHTAGHGFDLLHVAIDDCSRYLYVEALPDQTAATTAAFLERALTHFATRGVRIQRILTDNGMNYRSRHFRRVTRRHRIKLSHTRPYRPQTNGKAERVIQTLLREWAYQRPYTSNPERLRALRAFVKEYNTRRPHAALGGRPPVSRLAA